MSYYKKGENPSKETLPVVCELGFQSYLDTKSLLASLLSSLASELKKEGLTLSLYLLVFDFFAQGGEVLPFYKEAFLCLAPHLSRN